MIWQQQEVVKNGKVQKVNIFNWPKQQYTYASGVKEVKEWGAEQKQYWLLNRGWSERAAYMVAFNVSESEMKGMES